MVSLDKCHRCLCLHSDHSIVPEVEMTPTEIKQKIKALPFSSRAVTTNAIVDILLDQAAAGTPVGPVEMVAWIGDMLRVAEKRREMIGRESSAIPA